MADIREKITFDDSDLIAGLQKIDQQMASLNDKIRETEMSYEEAFIVAKEAMEDSTKAAEKTNQVLTRTIAETSKAKAASSAWRETIKEQVRELNLFGVNVGSVVDGLQKKAAAMRSVTGAVSGGTKALQIFKVALISTGIGAIVVALGSFVALLTKSQKGIDAVSVVLKSVGAVLDVFVDRAVKFGSALVNLFSGNFKAALNDAKSAVTGLGQEIAKEIKQAAELERRTQALREANRALNVEYAQRRKEIKELNLVAEDVTKSEQERVGAARKALAIEKELIEQRKAAAQEELAIIQEKNAMSESLSGDLDAEAEAKIRLAEIEAESFELQTTINNKVNAIEAEIKAKRQAAHAERMEQIRKANEELLKQVDLIEGAYQKLSLSRLSPEDRIKEEAEIAKREIENQFRILDEKAKAAGKEVDLSKEKTALLLAVEQEYQRELQKIRGENLADIRENYIEQIEIPKRATPDIVANVNAAYQKMTKAAEENTKSIGEVLNDIKFKFLKTFDLSEEEAAIVGQSLSSIFSSITSLTDTALAKNDELLASIQARREALESELEEELALQEKGLANNVSTKQRELDELQKAEEKAAKERDRLQKQAARQKLLADIVTQTSSLVTMGSNILAAESNKGLLGVPFAIAAIAAMLSIFAGIKAQAKGAVGGADAKFYMGGSLESDKVTGFVNPSGRTDRNGGRGHRVEDSNLILGGREFVVAENPAHYHSDFLQALNSGKYDGRDLIRELANVDGITEVDRMVTKMDRRGAVLSRLKERDEKVFQVRAMDAIMGKHIGDLGRQVSKLRGKTWVVPKGGGDVYVEDEKGNVKVVSK